MPPQPCAEGVQGGGQGGAGAGKEGGKEGRASAAMYVTTVSASTRLPCPPVTACTTTQLSDLSTVKPLNAESDLDRLPQDSSLDGVIQ